VVTLCDICRHSAYGDYPVTARHPPCQGVICRRTIVTTLPHLEGWGAQGGVKRVSGDRGMPAYRADQTNPTLPIQRRHVHRGPRRFAKTRAVITSPSFFAVAGLSCAAAGTGLLLQLSFSLPPTLDVPPSIATSSYATQTQPTAIETSGLATDMPTHALTVTTIPVRLGTIRTPSAIPQQRATPPPMVASPSPEPSPEASLTPTPSPSPSSSPSPSLPLPELSWVSPSGGSTSTGG